MPPSFMTTWRVTYRELDGEETIRDITADQMRSTDGWTDFIDDEQEAPALASLVLWSVDTDHIVNIVNVEQASDDD